MNNTNELSMNENRISNESLRVYEMRKKSGI